MNLVEGGVNAIRVTPYRLTSTIDTARGWVNGTQGKFDCAVLEGGSADGWHMRIRREFSRLTNNNVWID